MHQTLGRKLLLYLLIPLLVYFAFFCFYTYPWIANFSTSFFGDTGDGFQNVWNLWWMDKALSTGQSPWFTTYLHYPHGTTLLGHTLMPLNGFIAVGLMKIFSLVQTYNLSVLFSFVGTGLTAFWLCHSISKSYIGSLLGGLAFSFSSYHFAHAIGHMNLITMQWIPLFILAWWHFLQKPTYALATASAVLLLALGLTDFYYLLFILMAAGLMVLYFLLTKQLPLNNKEAWKRYSLFIVLALVLAAPLPLAVMNANATDPFIGSHNPLDYSIDLLSPFIPNQIWRFGHLTEAFWSRDHLDVVEGSVNLSYVVMIGAIIAFFQRKKLPNNSSFWFWMIIAFGILSIGPRLHVLGDTIEQIKMPYSLVARVLPFMKLAGVPVRMMVMVSLAASVLFASVIGQIKLKQPQRSLFLAVLTLILLFELWPSPLPLTPDQQPAFVAALKQLPEGAVIDQFSAPAAALYHQTGHERPIPGGYISRVSTSVEAKDKAIFSLLAAENFTALVNDHGIRYWILPTSTVPSAPLQSVYKDESVTIYDLTSQ